MSRNIILPGQTIGILGGGQLGRMMAIAAKEMGYRIAVLDPTEDSPTGQLADYKIVANYDDQVAAQALYEKSQVITYEFENVDLNTARILENKKILPQGSRLLEITRDRGEEKGTISSLGIKVAPYKIVNTIADLLKAVKEIGLPSVLKTTRGGYDGKGQFVLRKMADVEAVTNEITDGRSFILEKWVAFTKEISVIVTRNLKGEMTTFPVGENIHIDNILHQTIVPARISEEIKENAVEVAKQIAANIDLIGTLAVEMFLTDKDEIYVNELAPRPHNSGHYTIEACETSQFQQHIRAVCGWPLGSTELLKPAVMVNILGEQLEKILDSIDAMSHVHLHLYGKKEAKEKRKMGHITILGDTVEEALDTAKSLRIWSDKKMEAL